MFFRALNYSKLTFLCNSFPIVVVTLLLTNVLARLAHRVRSTTSAADPLEGFNKQPKKHISRVKCAEQITPHGKYCTGILCPLVIQYENSIKLCFDFTYGLRGLSCCQQKEQHSQVSLGAGQESCSQPAFPQTKHIPSSSHTMPYHLHEK